MPDFRAVALVLISLSCLVGCDSTTAEQHLENARAQMSSGDVRTAVIELKNALQKSPELSEARVLLGQAHARMGDHASALKEFEQALNLGVEDDRVRAGLLRAKVRLGRFNEVIGELEPRADLSPEFAVILGDAYLSAGDLAGADRMYERGLDLSDGSLGSGLVAWQTGDNARAETMLGRAVAIDPQNADAWLRKGEFELTTRELNDAEQSFGRASELPASRVLGRVGLVRVALLRGDLDGAGTEVARVLELAPDFPLGHYLDGLIRYEQEDLAGAESAIREVQRIVPDHDPSLYLMGAIKYRQGQLAQAEDSLQRFLGRNPRNPSAAKLLASIAFDRGNFERSVAILAPLADTSDPQLLAMLGAAQFRLGRPGDASTALERAVELAPDMAPFRNQLALSLLASGDSDRARQELETAVEVDGTQFESDYLLAMLRLREKDWDGADQAIASLVEKNPDNPVGYNLRGALLLARGESEPAARAFAAALEKDPSFLPAVQNLASLAARRGDWAKAESYYAEFLEGHPDHERALLALAQLSLRQNDVPRSTGLLERAISANPDSVTARLSLARLKLASGDVRQASDLAKRALEIAPDAVDAMLLGADLFLRLGDSQAAEPVVSRLQRRTLDERENGALALAVGQLQARLGQLSQARANLERAVTLTDRSLPAAELTLARIDLEEGDRAGARKRLDSLLADDATEDVRLFNAELLIQEGRQSEAGQLLQSLAQAGNRNAALLQARLDLSNDDTEGAEKVLKSWLDEHPDDQGARLMLADVQLRVDRQTALAHYESLATSGDPVALNNLAWLYMERNDPRAVETARRAVSVAPDDARVLDTLAWVLLKQGGDTEEAVELLRKSLRLDPDNPSLQYHLGVALAQSGDSTGARDVLNQAVKAGPFPELDEAREALGALADD